MRFRLRQLFGTIAVALLAGPSALLLAEGDPGQRVTVRAVHLDGRETEGRWLGSNDGQSIKLSVSDVEREIRVDDLAMIHFSDLSNVKESEGALNAESAVFHLFDGGRIAGELIEQSDETIVANTVLGTSTVFPFERLAAVQFATATDFPRSGEFLLKALGNRLPGHDVLITRSAGDAKSVRGRLEKITKEAGTFTFADRERSFKLERVFAIVFAQASPPNGANRVTATLNDENIFGATFLRASPLNISLAASFGGEFDLQIDQLRHLRMAGSRLVYLSDLKPAHVETRGILHKPAEMKLDRSAAGAMISLDGRQYEKGLGVKAYTEVVYDLEGEFATFVATVGMDDAVRPRGRASVRVLGDGKMLFQIENLTGEQRSQLIRIDVAGVQKLTVITDFGDAVDLSDHVDWGDARLIKPVKRN